MTRPGLESSLSFQVIGRIGGKGEKNVTQHSLIYSKIENKLIKISGQMASALAFQPCGPKFKSYEQSI